MKKLIIIILSLVAFFGFSFSAAAQKDEQRSDWLTYSLEVKMPGVSQEELFDRCRYISDACFGTDSWFWCNWDDENHIKCYEYKFDLFDFGKYSNQ